MDIVTLALSKKYTDDSLAGGGAVRGKNCTIQSKTPIEGGTRIVFAWTLDNCTSEGGQIYNSSYVAKCNATAYTQSYSDDYVTAATDTAAGGWNHTGILTWKNNRWENA